jgi:Uma2 family endonuclease
MTRFVTHKEDVSTYAGHPPLIVHLSPVLELTEDQFFDLAQLNRDLRIERDAQGELIMPPTGGETGKRNTEITIQLGLWTRQNGTGTSFGSSTGFTLPNGAVRSPDASWVEKTRLETLTDEQRRKFLPLCRISSSSYVPRPTA